MVKWLTHLVKDLMINHLLILLGWDLQEWVHHQHILQVKAHQWDTECNNNQWVILLCSNNQWVIHQCNNQECQWDNQWDNQWVAMQLNISSSNKWEDKLAINEN